MIPCNLEGGYQFFGGTCCLSLQETSVLKIGTKGYFEMLVTTHHATDCYNQDPHLHATSCLIWSIRTVCPKRIFTKLTAPGICIRVQRGAPFIQPPKDTLRHAQRTGGADNKTKPDTHILRVLYSIQLRRRKT